MFRKALLSVPFALAAAGSALPAQAEDLTFLYRAYELETADGRQVVLGRLTDRVERYCEARKDVRGLWQRKPAHECRAALLDELVLTIGDARLTALHEGRTRLAGQ